MKTQKGHPAYIKKRQKNKKYQLGWLCLLVNHVFMLTLVMKGTFKCMKETGEMSTTYILAFGTANKPQQFICYFAFLYSQYLVLMR